MFVLAEGTITVGRDSDNDIQIMEDNVSRHHAQIHNFAATCEIEDVGSLNGLFVNGNRWANVMLHHGDEVQIGELCLLFEECEEDDDEDHTSAFRDYSDRASKRTMRFEVNPVGDIAVSEQAETVVTIRPLKPRE
jgi:pSer/pThr/pTyr-binding forkhead associated (FHA) protein